MNGKNRTIVPASAQSSEPRAVRILSRRKPWAPSQQQPEENPTMAPETQFVAPAKPVETSMKPPTKRQLECLHAIDGYINHHGFPPSLREIARLLGKRSSNGTWLLVSYLERGGFLTVGTNQARSIRITHTGRAQLDHPFDCRAEARIEELGL